MTITWGLWILRLTGGCGSGPGAGDTPSAFTVTTSSPSLLLCSTPLWKSVTDLWYWAPGIQFSQVPQSGAAEGIQGVSSRCCHEQVVLEAIGTAKLRWSGLPARPIQGYA